jgi:chromate transporter
LLVLWSRIGLQSFGGGQSVLLYAYEALVVRRSWYTAEDWSQDWGLCQLAPGVNLISFAGLIGFRLSGPKGAVASLAGLLVPSITITVAMAAAYVRLRDVTVIRASVHGVLFAAAGGTFVNAIRVGRPLLLASRRDGRPVFLFTLLAVSACAGLALFARLPVIGLLIGTACATAIAVVLNRRRMALAPR